MTTDTSLVTFKAICDFTTELEGTFSKKHRPLKLYKRLIDQTTLTHEKAIKNHIMAFKKFCISNRDSIINKNVKDMKENLITYSKNAYIDMSMIFKLADKETTSVIWKHLLCISALLDPAGKAKEILKKTLSEGKTGGKEANFLTNIIDKVESKVDPNASPMEAVSSIMQSGIFNDLIGGMNEGLEDGSLDLGKLMGAVQGMVGQLGDKTGGNDPQAANAINMITSMVGNLSGAASGGSGQTPDLASLMQGLMPPTKVEALD